MSKIPDEIEKILKQVADRADPVRDFSSISMQEFTTLAGFIQMMDAPLPMEVIEVNKKIVTGNEKVARGKPAKVAAAVVGQPVWYDPMFVYDSPIKGDDDWSEILRLVHLAQTEYTKGSMKALESIKNIAMEARKKVRR